ncbi:SPAG4 protein, partial [Fregetta grallaria]|nr:SPAG4 protein [Fregetta grallaria]
ASPGYCWPFQQSRSEVLIQLPTQIELMSITLQHTSKIASPLETVSSAPRDFTVFVSLCRAPGAGTRPRGKAGLAEEGKDETLLGTFTYAMQKELAQTFLLQSETPRAFRFFKIVVRSNWGKPGYTCIYRVQVYGKIVETNAIGQTDV